MNCRLGGKERKGMRLTEITVRGKSEKNPRCTALTLMWSCAHLLPVGLLVQKLTRVCRGKEKMGAQQCKLHCGWRKGWCVSILSPEIWGRNSAFRGQNSSPSSQHAGSSHPLLHIFIRCLDGCGRGRIDQRPLPIPTPLCLLWGRLCPQSCRGGRSQCSPIAQWHSCGCSDTGHATEKGSLLPLTLANPPP